MAAVVGNMAGAAGGAVVKMAAEATDQGLISDTKLLCGAIGIGRIEEEESGGATVPRVLFTG
jgi:hypothetical protein